MEVHLYSLYNFVNMFFFSKYVTPIYIQCQQSFATFLLFVEY